MGCIASHIYHTQYFCSGENSFKPRICFDSRSNTCCISIFISDIFLSVSLLSFAKLITKCDAHLDTSSPGHQGTTDEPLMRSRRHTKLQVSLSLLLAIRRFMVLHPLSSITWVIILSQHSTSTPPLWWRLTNVHGRLYPFTRLVPCTSFFIFRSLELLI